MTNKNKKAQRKEKEQRETENGKQLDYRFNMHTAVYKAYTLTEMAQHSVQTTVISIRFGCVSSMHINRVSELKSMASNMCVHWQKNE